MEGDYCMLKKLISFLLVLTILFYFCFSSYAETTSSLLVSQDKLIVQIDEGLQQLKKINPNVEKTFLKIKKYVKQGLDANQTAKKLSKQELNELVEAFKQLDMSDPRNLDINNNLFTGLDQEDVRKAEEFAKEYYDYSKVYGKLPVNVDDKANTSRGELRALPNAVTYDSNFMQAGYYLTSQQIGAYLAVLSQIVGASFPYLGLLALVLGCALIVGGAMYLYYDYCSTIDAQVTSWFGSSSQNIVNASAITQAMVYQRIMYNYKYWTADLANYCGLGGVRVGSPITYTTARTIISQNHVNYNIISVVSTDATAACAGQGLSWCFHSAHTTDSYGNYKPLNLWHIHRVYPGGVQGQSHAFFIYY